jgi:peptidoglycan/LPS O-acetylase OafA/YrhL
MIKNFYSEDFYKKFTLTKKYRPEIDGLRAVAVLSVIFFHINSIYFSGGFLGVDIFFVISGYLITKILIEQSIQNKIFLISFYEGRIRRIFPALFFLILVIYIINFFILDDNYLSNFENSLKSVFLFYSNFYFWLETTDYFAPINSLKLLLHTWSLSIEEQFYVIYPLSFLFFIKSSRKNFLILIIIIFLLSLFFSHLAGSFQKTFPFVDFKNIQLSISRDGYLFFITPARVWQLLLGCIIALSEDKIKDNFKNINQNYLLFFFIILVSFLIFGDQVLTPSPSIITLIPLLCVGFIILFFDNQKKSLIKLILTNKYIVSIGLISYSLYLWHHPIINIKNYLVVYEKLFFFDLLSLIVIFIISFLSWNYIEKPFRSKNVKFQKVLIFLLTIIFFIFTINLIGKNFKKDMSLDKYSEYQNFVYDNDEYDLKIKEVEKEWNEKTNLNFLTQRKKILIFGDSHARDIFLALKFYEKLDDEYEFQFFVPDFNYKNDIYDIRLGGLLRKHKKILESSDLFNNSDYVLFAPSYNSYDLKYLDQLIEYFKSNDKKIIIFNQNPMFNEGGLRKANYLKIKKNLNDLRQGLYMNIQTETFEINKRLYQISNRHNLNLIDRFGLICDKIKGCRIKDDSSNLIYADYGPHFTIEGLKFLSFEIFRKKILKNLN